VSVTPTKPSPATASVKPSPAKPSAAKSPPPKHLPSERQLAHEGESMPVIESKLELPPMIRRQEVV